MQVVVKLSEYEGEVMHNICRGGLGGRIFCRVCQFGVGRWKTRNGTERNGTERNGTDPP